MILPLESKSPSQHAMSMLKCSGLGRSMVGDLEFYQSFVSAIQRTPRLDNHGCSDLSFEADMLRQSTHGFDARKDVQWIIMDGKSRKMTSQIYRYSRPRIEWYRRVV